MDENGKKVYWRVIDKDEETGEILITTSNCETNMNLIFEVVFFFY